MSAIQNSLLSPQEDLARERLAEFRTCFRKRVPARR